MGQQQRILSTAIDGSVDPTCTLFRPTVASSAGSVGKLEFALIRVNNRADPKRVKDRHVREAIAMEGCNQTT